MYLVKERFNLRNNLALTRTLILQTLSKPELCLGTAQFGMAYGVTNSKGKVSESEVKRILCRAQISNIRWLDTAQAYGDSESVLGSCFNTSHKFKIVSKLAPQYQNTFSASDEDIWDQSLKITCGHLGISRLDALLIHASEDLRKPGSEYLERWLLGLRERDIVERIGVSIYRSEDLEGLNLDVLDIVQLPLSLFDQRLINDGTVSRLKDRGIAVHARSIYLQGLLLTPYERWPKWFDPTVRSQQKALEELASERSCQLIDLALGFVRAQTELEVALIGLNSLPDLIELEKAWSRSTPWSENEWKSWGISTGESLDPRRWPKTTL